MIRVSHLIAVFFKRGNPLHKRKESSFAKQTTRKLRLDSSNRATCFLAQDSLTESPESLLVE